ncbi:MAG: hypothetical protein ACI81R_001909 [Bradymonadia bacterium]|jgi:hypothetical protein
MNARRKPTSRPMTGPFTLWMLGDDEAAGVEAHTPLHFGRIRGTGEVPQEVAQKVVLDFWRMMGWTKHHHAQATRRARTVVGTPLLLRYPDGSMRVFDVLAGSSKVAGRPALRWDQLDEADRQVYAAADFGWWVDAPLGKFSIADDWPWVGEAGE